MATPDDLRRQAEALTRVRVARVAREAATRELNAAIVAAVDAGAMIRDVAQAAELTRQRIHQITRGD